MGELLLSVLPYAIAAALAAPIVVVVTTLILTQSSRPFASAWVFTAGAAALDFVFIVALLLIADASGAFDGSDSEAGAIVDIVLGVIFAALGLFAVFSRPSPEKEAAQRARIRSAAAGGLRTMAVTGVLAQVINIDAMAVFTGAIKEVAEADAPAGQSAVALLFALAVMLTPYYGPAVVYAISPDRTGGALRRLSEWLLGHNRALEIAVGLGFGAVFLAKGLTEL